MIYCCQQRVQGNCDTFSDNIQFSGKLSCHELVEELTSNYKRMLEEGLLDGSSFDGDRYKVMYFFSLDFIHIV